MQLTQRLPTQCILYLSHFSDCSIIETFCRSRLQKLNDERMTKMKDEALGKLKELGNTILGNFGMSLDNFKMAQDPSSGSWNIRCDQFWYSFY
jgi:hypothetical protein